MNPCSQIWVVFLMIMRKTIIIILIPLFCFSCKKSEDDIPDYSGAENLTIFFVNDQHGQINNFSRIKYIVDEEKKQNSVIVVCSGDIFSGNPVVDYYDEKGYPMIDLMNRAGFDICVLGNHEYDYGEEVLKARMEQAEFVWVCANVDMNGTGVPEPYEYYTLTVDDFRVTFLGLVETNGKDNGTIPSTHPFRVQNFTFSRPESVVAQYSNIKTQENADLFIALTHIGHDGYDGNLGDYQLAEQFPYFDCIIGGHSHSEQNTSKNGIPIFQSGSYLNKLGRIELLVQDKEIVFSDMELIDLNSYQNQDAGLKAAIDQYNESMSLILDRVIGYSHQNHQKSQVGCFYTDALRERLDVDVSFQNSGGVRAGLNQGDITIGEVYAFDPFNNQAVIYEMTASDIKSFLKGSGSGFYYSGIQITQEASSVVLRDMSNNIIPNNTILRVGINDYIPAVYDNLFPAVGDIQDYTTAEAIIYYLENINDQVDYPDCQHYFVYQ